MKTPVSSFFCLCSLLRQANRQLFIYLFQFISTFFFALGGCGRCAQRAGCFGMISIILFFFSFLKKKSAWLLLCLILKSFNSSVQLFPSLLLLLSLFFLISLTFIILKLLCAFYIWHSSKHLYLKSCWKSLYLFGFLSSFFFLVFWVVGVCLFVCVHSSQLVSLWHDQSEYCILYFFFFFFFRKSK